MKLKIVGYSNALIPDGVARKHAPITDTAFIVVAVTDGVFEYTIIDAMLGTVGGGSFEAPANIETPPNDFALGRLGDRAVLFHCSYYMLIEADGTNSGWVFLPGFPMNLDDGRIFYRMTEDTPVLAEGHPAVTVTVGSELHVLTYGRGIMRARISADGGVSSGWELCDVAHWDGFTLTNSNNIFSTSATATPVSDGSTIVWATSYSLDGTTFGQGAITISADNTTTFGPQQPDKYPATVAHLNGDAATFIDLSNQQIITASAISASATTLDLGGDWYGTASIPPSFSDGAQARAVVMMDRGANPPDWGLADTQGKFYPAANVVEFNPPAGPFIELISGHVLVGGSGNWIILKWGNPAGVRYLRQRQTLTANTGSWPLRQKQNGGATGSWPLRQRQAA